MSKMHNDISMFWLFIFHSKLKLWLWTLGNISEWNDQPQSGCSENLFSSDFWNTTYVIEFFFFFSTGNRKENTSFTNYHIKTHMA